MLVWEDFYRDKKLYIIRGKGKDRYGKTIYKYVHINWRSGNPCIVSDLSYFAGLNVLFEDYKAAEKFFNNFLIKYASDRKFIDPTVKWEIVEFKPKTSLGKMIYVLSPKTSKYGDYLVISERINLKYRKV